MVEFRDSSFDIGVNTDLNFLNFDDDILTEAALRRITQMIDSRQEAVQIRNSITEPAVLRECKLFLNVKTVESVPSKHGCLGMCKSKYQCDVEILGSKQEFLLNTQQSDVERDYDILSNSRQSYFASDGKRCPPFWDLAEYYGPVKIVFKLKRRKLFKNVVVGEKTVFLSELLNAQMKTAAKQLEVASPNSFWSIDYAIPLSTSLKAKKIVTYNSNNNWLSTAKNASFPVSLEHHDEGKPMMESEGAPPLSSRAQAYAQVPGETNHSNKESKGATVLIRVEFRIVQFQNCQHLCMTQPLPVLATLCSTAPISRNIRAPTPLHSDSSSSTTQLHISELHLLAANAPAGVVVEVMRGLSRREGLAGALALRSAVRSFPATNVNADAFHASDFITSSTESSLRSLRFGAAGSRRTAEHNLGPSGSSNAHIPSPVPTPAPPLPTHAEGAPATWTPLEYALLNQQDATVFELLQRCGGLCFTNITVGQASPLHTAVRGGSPLCVEYLGRYVKKYGTKSVTGPGARLWSSSLCAKLEWKDQGGDTVLALACRLPRTMAAHSIVMYLLMLGADISALNEKNGYTPLMYACQSGSTKVVSILLSITRSSQDATDAILNVGDVNSILNNTAHLDVEPAVRDQIQAAIADAAHSARSSALALHLQSNQRSRNILRGENVLEGGYFNPMSLYLCDPCRRDTATGRHSLHIAAELGFGDIVQALLDVGMSCTDIDFFGDNSIHIASRRGHLSVVTKLVQAERRGWAAHLELVKQGKSLEVMHSRAQSLLVQNSMGDSAIDLAIEAGCYSVAEELVANAADIYGHVDHVVLRKLLSQLEESAARFALHLPVFSSASFAASTSSSGTSRRSHKHSHKERERDREDREDGLHRCRALLVRLESSNRDDGKLGCGSVAAGDVDVFRVNTGAKALLEAEFVDNEADRVEYLLALSSLGLKYIADNLSSTSGLQHGAAGSNTEASINGVSAGAVGNEIGSEEEKKGEE